MDTDHVWAAAFSPDGDALATANDDDTVRLWYRRTGRHPSPPLAPHQGRVRAVAFSPDGRRPIATGCDRPARPAVGRDHRDLPAHPLRPHRPGLRGRLLQPRRYGARERRQRRPRPDLVRASPAKSGRFPAIQQWPACGPATSPPTARSWRPCWVMTWSDVSWTSPPAASFRNTLSGHSRRVVSGRVQPDRTAARLGRERRHDPSCGILPPSRTDRQGHPARPSRAGGSPSLPTACYKQGYGGNVHGDLLRSPSPCAVSTRGTRLLSG